MENNISTKEEKISWTTQQTHVIDTRDGNLLVSAAAGSGKTAVLVERIIEMVLGTDSKGNRLMDKEPMDVDELLVVTFTNAAAAQMKEKIGDALQKKVDAMMARGEHDEHLIRQMTLINHANICTIDSFCLQIVKEYFAKVELDSAFDIADDTEMKILSHEVMDNVLERCYEDPELVKGFGTLVKTFARKESDMAIPELVNSVVSVISSYPEPHKWIESARKALDPGVTHETGTKVKRRAVMDIPMVRAYGDRVRSIICTALDMAVECQQYANASYGLEAYGLRIDQDVAMLERLKDSCASLEDIDLFELKDIYVDSLRPEGLKMEKDANGQSICYAFDRLVKPSRNADVEKQQFIKVRRDVYKPLITDIMSVITDADDVISQTHMVAPLMSALLDLTELYMNEFMKVKMEKNLFEFHDIEEFAFRILCDGICDGKAVPSETGREVAARYREILIDEYQDSNFLQEYILGSVSGHGEGTGNMFMVGDVKQSIYRFRMARPDLFIGKYDRYTRLADDQTADVADEGSTIVLTRNFRSEINVLKTVNAIFTQLMHREIGDIEYDAAAQLNSRYAVYDEAGDTFSEPGDVGHGPVSEFIMIANNTASDGDSQEYSSTEVEAAYIAGRIKEIVNGSSPVYVDQGSRKAEYRDIVVLLRSVSSASEIFDRAFEDAGIPIYIESEKGYFDAAEISCLVSMLSIIDNCYVDYDMAAVLRSPLVGLDEEQMARIVGEYRIGCEAGGTDYNARLFDKLLYYMDNHDDGETDISVRLGEFLNMLDHIKTNRNYMSISDMIRYILDATGYYWFAGARPMGRRRQANIDMLIRKADDFEKNSKGVFNFIRYVDELKTHDLDFAEADTVCGDENVVRVMTMHKSKGLEFPIVFVSGLGKAFNKMDTKANVLVHQDHYLACNLIDIKAHVRRDSFFRKVMADDIISETYAEEMRVLYVALTRAKEKLYMTACVKKLDDFKDKCDSYITGKRMNYASVMKAGCYAAWIYTALQYGDHDDCVVSEEISVDSLGEAGTEYSQKPATESVRENETQESGDELAENFCAAVKNGLDFHYAHRYSGLKSKMSITEIKRLQGRGEEISTPELLIKRVYTERESVPVPAFMREERVLHGNEIGTIYHKIMELADFDQNSMEQAEDTVRSVFELGLFDDVYRDRIKPEKIYNMIHSSLGQRMAEAMARGKLYRERQFYMMMKPGEILTGYDDCDDETIVVQGIIDAYFIEDGEIVLMDYKTDSVKEVSELVTRYHVQLDKYADVLEQLTGLKVKERIIYSFCLDATVNL